MPGLLPSINFNSKRSTTQCHFYLQCSHDWNKINFTERYSMLASQRIIYFSDLTVQTCEVFCPSHSTQGVNIILVKVNDKQIPQVITSHLKYQKVTAFIAVTTEQASFIVPCLLLLYLGRRSAKEALSVSWVPSVFSPGTRSSINTSNIWVTYKERNRRSFVTLQVQSGHRKPLRKPGTSLRVNGVKADCLRGGVTRSGTSPGRGQRPKEESLVPFPSASGSVILRGVRPEAVVRTGGGRGPGRPRSVRGFRGGVSYLGRGGRRDFGRKARIQLRTRTKRNQLSAGGTTAACPSPAADCGGTRARLRAPAGWVVPSGTVRVYWRRRRLLLMLLLAAPSRCSCASPFSSSCRRRRRLVPTAPIAAAATTAAPADPTRRYSPLRNPAQPSPPALPVRTPTSLPQVLIGEHDPNPPRRLVGPIAYHEGGGELSRERLRPPPENCRYLQVCLRGRVTGKGASQWQRACAQEFWTL